PPPIRRNGKSSCHAPSERGILKRTIGRWMDQVGDRIASEGLWCRHACVPSESRQADPVKCGELVSRSWN
ncbi:hypothetical protein HAX54_029032, partial [Datura stramonium]|nr:hypothetical protein [Datura stramonium]